MLDLLNHVALDRRIDVHLRSGHTFKGYVCESSEEGVLVLRSQVSSNGFTYMHVTFDEIVAWTDYRDTDGETITG